MALQSEALAAAAKSPSRRQKRRLLQRQTGAIHLGLQFYQIGRMQVGFTACIFILSGDSFSVPRSNFSAVMRSES